VHIPVLHGMFAFLWIAIKKGSLGLLTGQMFVDDQSGIT
jgi:hypothetical protein